MEILKAWPAAAASAPQPQPFLSLQRRIVDKVRERTRRSPDSLLKLKACASKVLDWQFVVTVFVEGGDNAAIRDLSHSRITDVVELIAIFWRR